MSVQQIAECTAPVHIKLNQLTPRDFISYYNRNKAEFDHSLHTIGAIKFQGVNINGADDFQLIIDSISSKFMSYIDGNSPRIKLSGNVYTSTEYDASQKITMHNELSYSAKWPGKLFFSCITPSQTGGETLLAHSGDIYRAMHPSIIEEIETRGICYIRNLHAGEGMGPSWQATFETESKAEVEKHLNAYNIEYEWGWLNNLKLKQLSKGILDHQYTGQKVWFNQIDQFHPLHLGAEMFETLEIIYGETSSFPMYVSFADGKEITKDFVEAILKTIETCTIAPAWNTNELLIVDNELMSHGRNSFTGNRRVLVAMSA